MDLALVVILVISHLLKVCADPMVVYKSTNIECFPDPSYIENCTCSIKAVNWNKAVAQLDCDLNLPLTNASVQMELFKKNDGNRYNPFLINVTINMCDVMAKQKFIPYGTIFLKTAKRFTNINHTCPFTGHLMTRNIYIDEGLFPTFPLGFYQMSLRITEGYAARPSKLVGVVKYYFQVKEMVKLRKKGTY